MKKDELKKYLFLITYGIALFLILRNLSGVIRFISSGLKVLTPLFIGLGLAFVLNILLRFYEGRLLPWIFRKRPLNRKVRRGVGVLLSYFTLLVIITVISLFIIPQISKSITSLSAKFPGYSEEITRFFNDLASQYGFTQNLVQDGIDRVNWFISDTDRLLQMILPAVSQVTKGITDGVVNVFMGFVFSVYMLLSKDHLILILKKIIYALFSKRVADRITGISSDANLVFTSFVRGQLTEALILGVLCFFGMMIFGMPYAPLISVIIGLTGLIPVLGAYIGTIPSALLILMESPILALWFVVFIIVLQQLEGNLIYPKVVGQAVGLNGLWVLLAIVVGGSHFGVIGILLGVPVLAVIYSLVSQYINNRIREKDVMIEKGIVQ